MILFLRLAWRNIWRNKRRSALTVAAVGFAIAVTIITRAMQYGTYERMIIDAVGLFSGDLQVQHPAYQKHETLGNSFEWHDSLVAILASIPEVRAFAPRVQGEALVGSGENTTGALIVGVDPTLEQRVTTIHEHVRRGRFLGSESHAALVGEQLAQRLQVDLGSELVVIVQGYDGSLGADLFRVEGIVKTGLAEFDAAVVVIPLATAQELFSMRDRVTQVVVALDEFLHIPQAVRHLQQRLDPQRYAILPWDELMPELVQLIGFDKAGGTFLIVILIIIVGFGILNTVLMMVLERIREFGVMMSIGMRPGRLFLLIVLEAFLLSLSGLVTGTALGAGVGAYLAAHPLPLPEEASLAMEAMGFKAFIYSKLTAPIFYESITLIVVLTVVVSFFPALRAASLRPVEALRRT